MTFTISNTMLPPDDALPSSVSIGPFSGTSIARPSSGIVTALFNIDLSEPAGAQDAVITFVAPFGTEVFTGVDGFTITEGADTAPTITEEPTSIYANTNSPAQFSLTVSGSSPMTYQWQKELVDLTAETNSTYNINAVRETDAGEYRCIAGNPFGSVTSDVVTLTIDTNVFAEGYVLTETGQASCYDTNGLVIVPPTPGEATAGTIPTDADSIFPVTGLSDTNITWTRELDRSYTLQYATNFTNEFQSVESGIVTTALTNNDLFESDLDTVFFRVIVE